MLKLTLLIISLFWRFLDELLDWIFASSVSDSNIKTLAMLIILIANFFKIFNWAFILAKHKYIFNNNHIDLNLEKSVYSYVVFGMKNKCTFFLLTLRSLPISILLALL